MRRVTAPRAQSSEVEMIPRLTIEPFDTSFSFKNRAYAALKNVIVSMDIYRNRSDIRLDERQLAQDFEIGGVTCRAGDGATLLLGAADVEIGRAHV